MGPVGWLQQMVDRIASTPGVASDPLVLRRARLIAGFSLAVMPFPLVAAVAETLLVRDAEVPHPALIAFGGLAGLVACLVLVRRGRVHLAGNLGALLSMCFISLGVWRSGGIHGATLVWLPIVPVVAVIFAGHALGLAWAVISVTGIALLGWADASGWMLPAAPDQDWSQLYALSVALVLVLLFLLVRLYERESERAVLELARIGELAQAASRAKSEFLANTSHEIRTPLTAIVGYAELLIEDIDRPIERARQIEMIETIRRNAEHLRRVLGDVLDLSRIEARRLELELGTVPVVDLLRNVTELMSVQAGLKGLELALELGPDTPPAVQTDETRLSQVLVNLLGNAIRFTERGSVRLVSALAGGDRLALEVIDTGPGLSEEQLGRIFQPFVQGDSSTTRTHGGTGLGLTISAALVDLMGGTLGVRSIPGSGSTFRIELPVGQPGAAPAAQREAALPGRPRPGIRVLLAEDGLDNQRLIRTLLERLACSVEIVPDGEQALARVLADSKAFDVVLLDMQMPVMDGYATARELRRQGVELPIVALTAHALSDERARCIAAGCTDYLSKPIDRSALAACLARHA